MTKADAVDVRHQYQGGVIVPKAPCNGCDFRDTDCHAKCTEYAAFRLVANLDLIDRRSTAELAEGCRAMARRRSQRIERWKRK